ncbi:hypothetical protein FQZ97_478220 [compost metagenome]
MLDSELSKTKKKTTVLDKAFAINLESVDESLASSQALEAFNPDSVQQDIRSSFGKPGYNDGKIGTHPDFKHLAQTENQENHYICSLFLDIKNSTRLTFLYDLEEVVAIKNTILKAAAESVLAMDGHVHRFMGDALLAFFGGKHVEKDDSIVNALNCASVLESIMTGTIIPVLKQKYPGSQDTDHLGFRIGLDYGSNEDVLWSSYGFRGVYEVTPTSFYVDVAAKLQSIAGKNKSMLGQSIIEEIDLPDDYTSTRIRTQTNAEGKQETIQVPTLPRTYTDRFGKAIRYKVRELNHAKYRDLLPFPPDLKEAHPNSLVVACTGVTFQCFIESEGQLIPYLSVSRPLGKHLKLRFKVTLGKEVHEAHSFPLELKLTKRNYGREAQLKEQKGVYEVSRSTVIRDHGYTSAYFRAIPFWHNDSTAYRGLHTMEAEIRDASKSVIFRDIIGVYIK